MNRIISHCRFKDFGNNFRVDGILRYFGTILAERERERERERE
jgi:hypothetical protein